MKASAACIAMLTVFASTKTEATPVSLGLDISTRIVGVGVRRVFFSFLLGCGLD